MRIAYLDCFSGISGDMTLGAFIDAGLGLNALKRGLAKLHLKGYELKARKVKRHEISGTKLDVIVKGSAHGHSHRPVKEIFRIIDKSSLKQNVKDTAKNIFAAIGEAEAKVHGTRNAASVLLHELGELDSIIDIVGTAIALDELGIDAVYASRVNMARAFVRGGHGVIPIPGPASLELLKGVPVKILDIEAELVTPTGAGILKALAKGFGEMPAMEIARIGYGAGSRDLAELPNMLRVIIGTSEAAAAPLERDTISVIEANIDDMNPQYFERAFERLFEAGALDVYTESIYMKKSRPAFKLTVLASPHLAEKLGGIILEETTSIGVRYHQVSRMKLDRKIIVAKTKYGNIRVKVSAGPGRIKTVSPEYDDCVKIARAKSIPIKEIYDEAKRRINN